MITGGSAVLAAVTGLTWSADLFDDVLWLMAIYTIASCYHSLCAQFIRAQGKMALYAGQGILNTVLVIGLNILFLLVFKWGITGYVLSTAVADILCSGFLVFKEKLWQYLTVKPGKGLLAHMLPVQRSADTYDNILVDNQCFRQVHDNSIPWKRCQRHICCGGQDTDFADADGNNFPGGMAVFRHC